MKQRAKNIQQYIRLFVDESSTELNPFILQGRLNNEFIKGVPPLLANALVECSRPRCPKNSVIPAYAVEEKVDVPWKLCHAASFFER